MNLQLSVSERLLTWLDVERVLKQQTVLWSQLPPGVLSIDCFADCVEIHHTNEATNIKDWLSNVFANAYQRDENAIRLRIGEMLYHVEIIEEGSNQSAPSSQAYPLWRDITYLPTSDLKNLAGDAVAHGKYPPVWPPGPDVVSFHSFKGGVGRTTALMTYVAACMQDPSEGPKKILVVDADLEAPGVSFWLDDVNRPTVSFVQLLEALHYPPAGLEATLDFFADELRKTSLNVSGMERELFVLPAALDLSEIQDMPVSPEHLARNPANPWQLSDHLRALGQRLGADAVFIDLRAGLSELASPILFDPRVDHFFVTTVAPQSVQGMREVLSRLHAFNCRLSVDRQGDARPTVVLSLLTKELREAGHYDEALRVLGEAYPNPTDDTISPGVQWLEAEFLSTLMSIGSLREALESLPQSRRLFASACEWASALYTSPTVVPTQETESADESKPISSRQTKAKKLYDVCHSAQFAESGASVPILATEPLLNLGKHFHKEMPNLLMIGAKGAGKTFTFRQLVTTRKWQTFLENLGFDKTTTADAAIFPVLWSSNIEDKPSSEGGEIKLAQENGLSLIHGDKQHLLTGAKLSRKIRDALNEPPESWEDFWDNLVAQQFDVNAGGIRALNQTLAIKGQRIILVFDGIEDAFDDATQNEATKAIQALLRLPNRISELESRHVGSIIFVREDYVQVTVRQNSGQLFQRYQPFRLQWNAASFLRLVFMLSCQAGIYPDSPKAAESLRIDELKSKLEALWGKKLGSEKSKEAHSARWVYAALCDLKGNLQARDLVRFLSFAADSEAMRTGTTWSDRILSPESMRKAIPLCSKEKVDEAKQEIAPLKRWADLLESNSIRKLKVPFNQTEAMLDSDVLSALKEIGVIYEDLEGDLGDDRLFLPEIYRYGMGFETSSVGRPRTQALLKKNIGSIPL